MEGNDSLTHTEKFKKRQNPSRARDSHIAILAYTNGCPPYIDLLHLFVSTSKFMLIRITNVILKRRSENVIRAPKERLKKQGN